MEIISISNASASAKIALQGGHIFHYQRMDEEPILWLSEDSKFEKNTAIRGGIPICWPWFGLHVEEGLPAHGFARTSLFKHTNTKTINANTTQVNLELMDSAQSMKLWDFKFKLELQITIGEKLILKLKTTNLDKQEFKLTQAFHTYFSVSDILHVEIDGLQNKPYLDALTWEKEIQSGLISFSKEVDRVYQEVDKLISLKDKNHTLHVESSGSSSTVVWNPWIEKCKRMSLAKADMKQDAYKKFVCIETANAFDDFIVLKPNNSHTLEAIIY